MNQMKHDPRYKLTAGRDKNGNKIHRYRRASESASVLGRIGGWISGRSSAPASGWDAHKLATVLNVSESVPRKWGYDPDGFDAEGYTSTGYDRDGYNRDGFNRRGFNRDGYHRDNLCDRDGYRANGLDTRGWSRDHKYGLARLDRNPETGRDYWGFNEDGTHPASREDPDEIPYDEDGVEASGLLGGTDRDGRTDFDYHRHIPTGLSRSNALEMTPEALAQFQEEYCTYGPDGFNRAGFDRDGYDRDGFDRRELDRWAYDRDGMNHREWLHRSGGPLSPDGQVRRTGFDRDGFDIDGFGRDGFDADGFNRGAWDRDGRHRETRTGSNPDGIPYEYWVAAQG